MTEKMIPMSFIDCVIEHLESELEYELYEDDDRKKCLMLSSEVSALKELKNEWLKTEMLYNKKRKS